MIDDDGMEYPEPSQDTSDSDSDSQPEGSTSQSDLEIASSMPTVTHTITFKCIGANRSCEYQDALNKVTELSKEGHNVPVNIFCEPDNTLIPRQLLFGVNLETNGVQLGTL